MKKKYAIFDLTFDAMNMALMITMGFLTAYPFLYIIAYSFSDSSLVKGILFWPVQFNLDSYMIFFKDSKRILNAFAVSIARSTVTPLISIFVVSMAAYCMTRRELIGRKVLLKYFIITMYFNSGMIPVYILYKQLHLTGNFFVYVFPYLISVFNFILVKTYIESLPKSLEESAYIDGANDLYLFYKIILPLIKPVIAAILLFECVKQWNNYVDTMLYNASIRELHTLQYVLMLFISSNSQSQAMAELGLSRNRALSQTSMKMALTVLTTVPILLVYPFLQKHFTKGLLIGSVKG